MNGVRTAESQPHQPARAVIPVNRTKIARAHGAQASPFAVRVWRTTIIPTSWMKWIDRVGPGTPQNWQRPEPGPGKATRYQLPPSKSSMTCSILRQLPKLSVPLTTRVATPMTRPSPSRTGPPELPPMIPPET